MSAVTEIGTVALNPRESVRVSIIKDGKIDLRLVSKLNDLTGVYVPTAKGMAVSPVAIPKLITLLRRASKEVMSTPPASLVTVNREGVA